MTLEDIFGEWLKCISISETVKVNNLLSKEKYCQPKHEDIFKAFQLCPYNDFRVLILGQDPYPQPGIATGVAFANDNKTEFLSPSLEIIKNSMISFAYSGITPIFVPDLSYIARQGVLWLNSSLTVRTYEPESHKMIWRQWMKYFLTKLGEYNSGMVCVLFGSYAQSFEKYLGVNQYIFKEEHPAALARKGQSLRPELWNEINDILNKQNKQTIHWYENSNNQW